MKKIVPMLLALVLVLAGCGGEAANTEPVNTAIDMQELYAQIEAVGMPEMLELDENMQLNLYGIEAGQVKQSKVVVCSDGLRADEIWLVEAVDAGAAQAIKGLADNRVSQKDAESVTYSPEQNAVVKKSFVAVEGNYVFFICSPDVEAMTAVVNTALGK